MNPQEPVRAAGILLMTRTPQEFLLMRHKNRWDLPKGHCDAGETFLQTAKRETLEETGIAPEQYFIDPEFEFQIQYPVTYKRYKNQTFNKTVCYFLAYLETKPDLVLTEHPGAEWFAWDPPHKIQEQTIDPLLHAVEKHLSQS